VPTVGVTFAVAVPLIIAAFKIQSMLNAGKTGWIKLAKEMKKSREGKRKDDYMPDFLKEKDNEG
jgi:hypothetical protein